MKCILCNTTENVSQMKHLPLPDGQSGWITLKEWTNYCTVCARKEAIEADEAFKRAVEKAKGVDRT